MLITVDILLGLSIVMLLVSMAVTVLSQFVTNVLNSRGRHLLYGLADLLQQIDPDIDRTIALKITGTLLIHPMIHDAMGRYGATIHREEFTKLLMDLASGNNSKDISERLGQDARTILLTLLEKNGVSKPAETLDKVRLLALQLEMSNPELSGSARQNIALMRAANSHFVAKINTWFDQTIDRVSIRFTITTRIITVICSLMVACVIQLDAIQLINRLSIDTELRNSLVEKAVDMGDRMEQTPENLTKLSGQNKDDIRQLLQLGILHIPKNYHEWHGNWVNINPFGILFSVVLLSLGAPFWYNTLKNLLKLRSSLAGKDDQQRLERQTTQIAVDLTGASDSPQNQPSISGKP